MCSFGSCQTRFEFLSQFRKVRNAFECFVTAVAKKQTRLTYEDKRDLYCIIEVTRRNHQLHNLTIKKNKFVKHLFGVLSSSNILTKNNFLSCLSQ